MTSTLFCLLAQDDAVKSAIQAAAALRNYEARVALTIEGGGDNAFEAVLEGGYTEEEGFFLAGRYLNRDLGVYRKGAKSAVMDQDGQWKNSSKVQYMPGRPGPLRGVSAPHDELRGLESRLKGLKKVDPEKRSGKKCDAYVAELTEEGARALFSRESRPLGRMAPVGDVKLWLDPSSGALVEYMIFIEIQGQALEKSFRAATTRTVAISRPNEAKLKIPAAARQALE